MSSSRSMLPLVMVAAGAAFIVPVMLGTVWNTWRAQVEGRQPDQAAVEEAKRLQAERDAARAAQEAAAETLPQLVGDPVYDKDSDRVLLDMFTEYAMTEERIDDVLPDQPFRVDALRGANNLAGTLRVDLGRDGRIDEEWSIHESTVVRHSDPHGAEFAKHDRWENRWVPVEGE